MDNSIILTILVLLGLFIVYTLIIRKYYGVKEGLENKSNSVKVSDNLKSVNDGVKTMMDQLALLNKTNRSDYDQLIESMTIWTSEKMMLEINNIANEMGNMSDSNTKLVELMDNVTKMNNFKNTLTDLQDILDKS